VRIGECATISPGANLAGAVKVGERAYIGMGAQILEKRRVGDGAIVGAGAVVTRDVPARTKVMGVPARVVDEEISGL
jgi:acetyltransferase-like isoleucine patch superfamily enzyme